MDKLFDVIDNRIKKVTSAQKNTQIKPAIVKNVTETTVEVTPIGMNVNLVLPNYTGSFINVGDEVRIAYTGQNPQENNAYIIGTPHSIMVIPAGEYNKDTAIDGVLYFCYREEE